MVDVEAAAKEIGVLERFPLGDGLELWKVVLETVREQDLNARSQAPTTFEQLSSTIGNQGRLESLPFCAVTDKGIELISGHHRTRAARKAGLTEVWVLVDVTGLPRDQIKAKQLAHNAIQGKDNPEIVKRIFDSIEDVDAKLEAFIEPDFGAFKVDVALSARELDIDFDAKTVVLMFLPSQHAVLKKAIEALTVKTDEVYVATREEYDLLVDAVAKAGATYDIRSTPTIFAKMAEIVIAQCEADEAAKEEESGQAE